MAQQVQDKDLKKQQGKVIGKTFTVLWGPKYEGKPLSKSMAKYQAAKNWINCVTADTTSRRPMVPFNCAKKYAVGRPRRLRGGCDFDQKQFAICSQEPCDANLYSFRLKPGNRRLFYSTSNKGGKGIVVVQLIGKEDVIKDTCMISEEDTMDELLAMQPEKAMAAPPNLFYEDLFYEDDAPMSAAGAIPYNFFYEPQPVPVHGVQLPYQSNYQAALSTEAVFVLFAVLFMALCGLVSCVCGAGGVFIGFVGSKITGNVRAKIDNDESFPKIAGI